ncbi:MAG TPA: hypothetical protein VLU46_06000 [Thermoanaerobaculia bacterium]|nr:hypothetical protein [Thermoanaerobaculia bacterium]
MIRNTLLLLLLAAPVAAREPISIRVLEPAAGTILTGGSTAVIQWSGTIDRQEIEEWEAFLSVDGGRYYSVRVTPHLDVSVREFRWTVPNVASRNVRILLRFGNEKDEFATELPLALTIEPASVRYRPTQVVPTAGEAARPGDAGVAQWAEGDRSGAHVTLAVTSTPAFASVSNPRMGDSSTIASPVSAFRRVRQQPWVAATGRSRRSHSVATRNPEILLFCCRLNI